MAVESDGGLVAVVADNAFGVEEAALDQVGGGVVVAGLPLAEYCAVGLCENDENAECDAGWQRVMVEGAMALAPRCMIVMRLAQRSTQY